MENLKVYLPNFRSMWKEWSRLLCDCHFKLGSAVLILLTLMWEMLFVVSPHFAVNVSISSEVDLVLCFRVIQLRLVACITPMVILLREIR